MMEVVRQCGGKGYLYTSAMGYMRQVKCFTKMMYGKLFHRRMIDFPGGQADANRIEYGWDCVSIVRPTNGYGPYDNFDPNVTMVIPSLIAMCNGWANPLVVWGDGEVVMDFIHAKNVACC
tara:strand:+ start:4498 stop:4857 length:360 start_codon:yes stop_codon:yes gene_type:complete